MPGLDSDLEAFFLISYLKFLQYRGELVAEIDVTVVVGLG